VANGEPGSTGPGSAGPGSGGLGILTAQATPESARRIWPWWLALGVGAIAVAVAALFLVDDGARLLVGAFGVALSVRGVLLLRAAGSLSADLVPRAKGLGVAALAAGVLTLAVAVLSSGADRFLLVAVPLVLLAAAAGTRSRRSLLAVAVLVTALLVGLGVTQGWDRAAETATVLTALMVAGFGVPMLLAAMHLRTIAARPAPAAPAGCAGCACGAGGCGS
jgi:hypothetical protein